MYKKITATIFAVLICLAAGMPVFARSSPIVPSFDVVYEIHSSPGFSSGILSPGRFLFSKEPVSVDAERRIFYFPVGTLVAFMQGEGGIMQEVGLTRHNVGRYVGLTRTFISIPLEREYEIILTEKMTPVILSLSTPLHTSVNIRVVNQYAEYSPSEPTFEIMYEALVFSGNSFRSGREREEGIMYGRFLFSNKPVRVQEGLRSFEEPRVADSKHEPGRTRARHYFPADTIVAFMPSEGNRLAKLSLTSLDCRVFGPLYSPFISPPLARDFEVVLAEYIGEHTGLFLAGVDYFMLPIGVAEVPEPPTEVSLLIGSTAYTINGVAHTSNAAPFIDHTTNSPMIPLRTIADVMGATLVWHETVRTVEFSHNNMNLHIAIDVPLPSPVMATPVIVYGNTFVCWAYVSAYMGISVQWDNVNYALHLQAHSL